MSRLGPEDWIHAACATIGRRGVEGMRVEALAREMKVSKGSFYWHFENRAALLSAVLAYWEAEGTDAIISRVEERGGTPRDRLWTLIGLSFYSDVPFENFELNVRAWARGSEEAEKVVRRVDRHRLAFVAQLLEEAGVRRGDARLRAALLYRALVGEMALQAYGNKKLPQASVRFLWEAVLGP